MGWWDKPVQEWEFSPSELKGIMATEKKSMSDKLYTVAEVREAFRDGHMLGLGRGTIAEAKAEALRRWPDPPPDKEEKR
jgi:hypothetical protein